VSECRFTSTRAHLARGNSPCSVQIERRAHRGVLVRPQIVKLDLEERALRAGDVSLVRLGLGYSVGGRVVDGGRLVHSRTGGALNEDGDSELTVGRSAVVERNREDQVSARSRRAKC